MHCRHVMEGEGVVSMEVHERGCVSLLFVCVCVCVLVGSIRLHRMCGMCMYLLPCVWLKVGKEVEEEEGGVEVSREEEEEGSREEEEEEGEVHARSR